MTNSLSKDGLFPHFPVNQATAVLKIVTCLAWDDIPNAIICTGTSCSCPSCLYSLGASDFHLILYLCMVTLYIERPQCHAQGCRRGPTGNVEAPCPFVWSKIPPEGQQRVHPSSLGSSAGPLSSITLPY